jgi:hypothetical protein
MLIKSFMGYFYGGYFCLHGCRGSGVSVICSNGLHQCFICLRDGYVRYCHPVSVIVMSRFVVCWFSPLSAACSHFGCSVRWFPVEGGGGRVCVLLTGVHCQQCPEYWVMCMMFVSFKR